MTIVTLAEVADINPPMQDRPAGEDWVSFIRMADLDAVSATTSSGRTRQFKEVSKGYTIFCDQDLLVAKITPCFENQKIGQANLRHRIGVGSSEFHVVRPRAGRLNVRYLLHFLRQDRVRIEGERRMTGSAGQRRVPAVYLDELRVPLPPLDEQRRIAAMLDQADALRAKRRQTLDHLDSLVQSIFLDMFPTGSCTLVSAAELMPSMRNGLSPATAGDYPADVLTLSAVTQGRFNPSAVKPGRFAINPPSDKRVSASDFLICRGNGNKALVGVGAFSRQDHPDLVFPDTVIAGRVNPYKLTMPYLDAAWKQQEVRRQIESLARTTNGTYKVNQHALASVMVSLPPLPRQHEFDARIERVNHLRAAVQRASACEGELLTSIQSRAFYHEP